MNRRTFLTGMAVSTVSSVLALPQSANALIECTLPDRTGNQLCQVGIDSGIATIMAQEAGSQRQTNWCWAACIEMIFRYYGYVIPQEAIVQQTFGTIQDRAGSIENVLYNLNTIWIDSKGRRFQVQSGVLSAEYGIAAQELMQDRPLILARAGRSVGHAMLLTALKYQRYPNGSGYVTQAIVRDPAPGQGRRALLPEEWDNVVALVWVHVARWD